MNNWVMGFDGFIGALTGDGNAIRNTGRGQSAHAGGWEEGGGYIDVEVEGGMVIQMRKIRAEDEEHGGLDEF